MAGANNFNPPPPKTGFTAEQFLNTERAIAADRIAQAELEEKFRRERQQAALAADPMNQLVGRVHRLEQRLAALEAREGTNDAV